MISLRPIVLALVVSLRPVVLAPVISLRPVVPALVIPLRPIVLALLIPLRPILLAPARAAVLAALLLCACTATPPPSRPEAPENLPPLARAALDEWEAWGRIVVEGWPDDRPADTAATPARFERLLDYWYALPGNSGVARRLALRRAGVAGLAVQEPYASDGEEAEDPPAAPMPLPPEDIGLYASPAWSAAFIGFVARRAGVGDYDLPSMPTHARYIDRVLRRAIEDPEGAAWLPYAPEHRPLRSGDLLCADRSNNPLAHWTQRLTEHGRFRPMHCDVVIRLRPGVVEAVGGNVADMVVLRRFPADADGHVLPAPPGRPPFLLVLSPSDAVPPERAAELAALSELLPGMEPLPPPRRISAAHGRRSPARGQPVRLRRR